MICPRCSADNPAGMKFCGQCGAPLGGAGPACGSNNPLDHKFCGQCGAPLGGLVGQDSASPVPYTSKPAARPASARSTLPGEMKQVTVLLCDIVGSTPLTERLGAEAMRDLSTVPDNPLGLPPPTTAEGRRPGDAAPIISGARGPGTDNVRHGPTRGSAD